MSEADDAAAVGVWFAPGVPEIALESLADDDFPEDDDVFEPTGWDLAVTMNLQVDPDTDRVALDELADVMLVWAEDPDAERLIAAAAATIWSDELAKEIRRGLAEVAELGPEWKPAAEAALEEVDLLGSRSEIAREVVAHLAMQLSHLDHAWTLCVCCIDEAIVKAPPEHRRELARQVALVACRNAAVPDLEIRAALAAATTDPPAARLATDERRRAVRYRLGRIGRVARTSMPVLAAELEAIAAEPLSERPLDDDVWCEVCRLLLAEVMRPELN